MTQVSNRETPAPADIRREASPVCTVCGSTEAQAIPFDHLPGTTLYQCGRCDVQFFHPIANPGSEWYEETYVVRNVLEVARIEWYHRQFLNSKGIPSGRLLDVGCGTGSFLAAAQTRGFTVSGLDFDVAAVNAAHDKLGIEDVHAWSFDEYMKNRPGDVFDVTTAFEVLEHQEDPRGFLASCFAITRPGGHFAISVPYRDRRPRWREPWDQPPNHLTRWSKKALLDELSKAGFTALEVRTGSVSSKKFLLYRVRFGVMSSRMKATRIAEPGAHSRRVTVATLLLRAKSAAFGGLGAMLDIACRAFGATGIYLYVLAKRPD